jgi:hypothetical protein
LHSCYYNNNGSACLLFNRLYIAGRN